MNEERVRIVVENYLMEDNRVSSVLREQTIIDNGLRTDVTTYDDSGNILHIVECKGSISLGGLAGGVGQAYQYYHQAKLNPNAENAQIIFACPRTIQNQLDKLIIPNFIDTLTIAENETVLVYNPPTARGSSKFQIPGTVYTEGFELKFVEWVLKAIIRLMSSEVDKIDRDDINDEMLRIAEENGDKSSLSDHTNTLITVRSLNIIDKKNFLTPKGYRLYGMLLSNYGTYRREMISYFYPNFIHIQNALIEIAKRNSEPVNSIHCTHSEISEEICNFYGGEVRYFNNTRRISTMMKMSVEIGMIIMNEDRSYHLNRMVSPYLPPLS